MTTLDLFVYSLVFISFLAFSAVRLLTYLHAFQQEEYEHGRFASWLFSNFVFDKRASAAMILIGGLWFFSEGFEFIVIFLEFLTFAYIAYSERDPRKDAKKKLAMTARAKRIYFISLFLCVIPASFIFFISMPWVWVGLIQAVPFYLLIVNTILQPFENINQSRYWNEANAKIKKLDPIVIGVTGSFGKTSIKHILGHILSNEAPTLITPGSVNTPMGISRIVREELNDSHKYFIVEMGAYGPGSIERLCRLAPPNHAIISAIGHAHYERFKTLDAVAKTKYELAESALKNEGEVIIHEKTLKFEYAENMRLNHIDSFVVCGTDTNNKLVIERAEQTPAGLDIKLKINDKSHKVYAPIFGIHHSENIALSFAMAIKLGLEPENIINAIKTLPQIAHRLEVRRADNKTIIDDAYNSNPVGFKSALDLLGFLGKDNRKILITPGMVELGNAHDDMHRKLGAYAASKADVVLAVQPKRIKSFISGYRLDAKGGQLVEFDTFDEAQKWVSSNSNDNDVILIENDLPDIYERIPKL